MKKQEVIIYKLCERLFFVGYFIINSNSSIFELDTPIKTP